MLVREGERKIEKIVVQQFEEKVEQAIGKIAIRNWDKGVMGFLVLLSTKLGHSVLSRNLKEKKNGKRVQDKDC